MSGLNEIEDWVDSEVILDFNDTPESAYNDISNIFTSDNRSPLDTILGNDRSDFIQFLSDELTTANVIQIPRAVTQGFLSLFG